MHLYIEYIFLIKINIDLPPFLFVLRFTNYIFRLLFLIKSNRTLLFLSFLKEIYLKKEAANNICHQNSRSYLKTSLHTGLIIYTTRSLKKKMMLIHVSSYIYVLYLKSSILTVPFALFFVIIIKNQINFKNMMPRFMKMKTMMMMMEQYFLISEKKRTKK
jgi:hypothetical protein